MARTKTPSLKARIKAVLVLSQVLASGRGGGHDPSALSRRDMDRFVLRLRSLRSPITGEPFSDKSLFAIASGCRVFLQEATAMGFLPGLDPTFSFRRGDINGRFAEPEEGRAIPAHVIAQLDSQLDLLRAFPGASRTSHIRTLGVVGERAGDMVVLAYLLLKGTGRRLGEIASLHLDCLSVDEHGKAVLIYDNHKAGRMRRRLPLADTALVEAIRDQQRWVVERFPGTPREDLWLLPKPRTNVDGSAHLAGSLLSGWIRAWVRAIPRIDTGPANSAGDAAPFDRSAINPRAFRPTYAQTLADQGVAPSVLRDLMDHRSMNTTLGYYRVNESKKRQAMEMVARHTVNNRGAIRPVEERSSRLVELREELSWVAVPMGKCSEPTNVRAGGQACPIRYQCAGCPHFESDPSYLPEQRSYADDLRREKEMLLAVGATDWVVDNVARQLESLSSTSAVTNSCWELSARNSVGRSRRPPAPCARPGSRCQWHSDVVSPRRPVADNSAALTRARRSDGRDKRVRANDCLAKMLDAGEPISFPALARRGGVSVSLLYSDPHLASRVAEARDRQRQAGTDRAWRLPPRSLVTEQSLRTELANAKEQLRQLHEEVNLLRQRLARSLGSDADLPGDAPPPRWSTTSKTEQPNLRRTMPRYGGRYRN